MATSNPHDNRSEQRRPRRPVSRSKRNVKVLTDEDGNETYYLDVDTGEVLNEEDSVALLTRRRHKVWDRERWVVVFDEGPEFANTSLLPPSAARILHGILPEIEFGNWLVVNQRELADNLSTGRSTVNRALGKLKDHGILLDVTDDPSVPKQIATVGQLRIYRVNPFIYWRGRRVDVSNARRWWKKRTE